MHEIAPQKLEDLATRIFVALGAPEPDARDVGRHLVGANLAGHDSHGVIRVPTYVQRYRAGRINAGAEPTTDHESATTAVLNANRNFGQVSARRATDLALAKAQEHDLGMVTVYNCNHVGRVGAYAEQIAAAGMMGMAVVNNDGGGRLMAAYGGIAPRTSPNPIAFAVPTGTERPFVVDMTASVVAGGKISVQRNKGEPLPPGWAITADGSPAVDPEDYYGPPQGAILPMGAPVAHKGFALALMVDLLGGGLSKAQISNPAEPEAGNGFWVMATRIEAFTARDEFERKVNTLLDYVSTPPYAPGFDEILTPGLPEQRSRERRAAAIPLDDETWRQVDEVAQNLGVAG